jgi:hypothetical protein
VRLLLVCIAVIVGVVAVQTAHPCDVRPSGPWVTGNRPVVGWCQSGDHSWFIVSADGVLYDIGKPAPAFAAEGLHGTYYEWRWPSGVGRGQHHFAVRAYTAQGGMQGPQASVVFTR